MSSQSFSQFEGEMAELLDSFIVETNEISEKLGPDLLKLEKDPADKELHNRIFRAVHTVKGTSGFLGLDQMTELAHVFEDVLNKIRKGELEVTRHRMDVMFDAFDVLKELLARVE
ncbi:MAG: Hpt domain-containing protein, partial [Ignavibacteriales bacterium]|nr:Hpt domain-containing protein [Ignavibacteriales bacterium]